MDTIDNSFLTHGVYECSNILMHNIIIESLNSFQYGEYQKAILVPENNSFANILTFKT